MSYPIRTPADRDQVLALQRVAFLNPKYKRVKANIELQDRSNENQSFPKLVGNFLDYLHVNIRIDLLSEYLRQSARLRRMLPRIEIPFQPSKIRRRADLIVEPLPVASVKPYGASGPQKDDLLSDFDVGVQVDRQPRLYQRLKRVGLGAVSRPIDPALSKEERSLDLWIPFKPQSDFRPNRRQLDAHFQRG